MQPLSEAKQFVGLHARYMGLKPAFIDSVLSKIHALDGERPGCWAIEWSREAELNAVLGEHRKASNLYNLARFPCADSEIKREAASEASRVFAEWLQQRGMGQRRFAHVDGVSVPFVFRPGPERDSPLVVLMGGIVSLKEQWGSFLGLGTRLGCAVAIADFPGVGENGVPYTRAAGRVFSAIMDDVAKLAESERTLILAPSFGGHLAMLQSLIDPRIQSIVTVGAPISHFFDPLTFRRGVPTITRNALRHTAGEHASDFEAHVAGLALSRDEVRSLPIPMLYVASLRDEIIPARDWREAAALNQKLRLYTFDDVHGSPRHLRHTRLLVLGALCRHAGRARLARWLARVGHIALNITPAPKPHSFA